MLLLLLFCVTVTGHVCHNSDTFVGYRMTMTTFWTEDNFPKDYPKFRPPAQWSALFGQSHERSHSIFENGEMVSPALQKFVEQADMRYLMSTGDNDAVFDQFTAPPILQGQGETTQDFFLDAEHHMVSVVCKIIPSPDWFVGLNSFSLCYNGTWPQSLSVYLDPLDGGTDGGLTFTSPRWRAEKPEGVTTHAANYPSHPAASFFYPNLTSLPHIALLQFTLIGEYPLIESSNSTMDNMEVQSNDTFDNSDVFQDMTASFVADRLEYSYQNEPLVSSTSEASIENSLNEEANEIVSNVKTFDSKYFPKAFRQKSNVKVEEKWSSSLFIPSNLMVSRLPSKLTSILSNKSSHFEW